MLKELTKLILGIIIVGGAVYAALYQPSALEALVGLAGLVIGYYFKDITGGFSAAFGGKQNQ